MAFFNATQAALAAGRTVFAARLVHFDFAERPMHAWEGVGPLELDGATWLGLALIGSIGEIPVAVNDEAGSVDFTLSGVSPEIVARARDSASVRGREVTIYGQMFGEDLQPADAKYMLAELEMDVMSYAGTGPNDRRIRLTAESIWADRNGAAQALYSDRDQQLRFPGDLGCALVAALKNKRVDWPRFS